MVKKLALPVLTTLDDLKPKELKGSGLTTQKQLDTLSSNLVIEALKEVELRLEALEEKILGA